MFPGGARILPARNGSVPGQEFGMGIAWDVLDLFFRPQPENHHVSQALQRREDTITHQFVKTPVISPEVTTQNGPAPGLLGLRCTSLVRSSGSQKLCGM